MSISETDGDREAWLASATIRNPEQEQARFGANTPAATELALEEINPVNPHLFRENRLQDHFERLRREDPVHFNELGSAGRYWSLTKWEDIREVESNAAAFSSADGITIGPPVGSDVARSVQLMAFIAMDPPAHGEQRRTVQPMLALSSLRNLEPLIRERTISVLDSLPEGETFDWVDTVSIELTTLMLATLFDFPLEDRRKLTRWSDVVTSIPEPGGIIESSAQRREELAECLSYFERLWEERRENPGHDLVSMLVHGEATGHMPTAAHLGNLILLIVGGNDTTRNTMSGSVYALNQFPDQFDKLKANPDLVESFVQEIIRWQTPLSYMRRTATEDCEIGGKQIRKHDQILMWYVSANRDEDVFGDTADDLDIERPDAYKQISFGYGIHYCLGSRLAELQLRILWEEILARFDRIELQAEPERTFSSFIKGYTHMPVQVARK
ncbi:MAG: cytochrome P450 [Actinomycetota bacterium]|nr:cytochrome P450 [Actinomycetota bacterium]